jgi:hypothetical protein
MFFEAPVNHSMPIVAEKAVWAPGAEAPAPPVEQPPLTDEQVRAAEAVFAARQRESDQVASMLGIWTGAMILKDLTTETFTEPVDEVEPRLRSKDDSAEEE